MQPTAELRHQFAWVSWIVTRSQVLIPHLWGEGLRRAKGDVVAITTSHFLPASEWIASLRAAHARLPAAALGGPIDPPRGKHLVDWATYFLRYNAYLSYTREQAVHDLAGDNVSYKRAALEAYPGSLDNGFWELELHRVLLRTRQELVYVPEIRVRQQSSFGFRRFLSQRFQHGRQFGQSRFQGRPAFLRMAGVALAPLIPLVFLTKIVRNVVRSGRDKGPFVASSPVLVAFLLAWSLGEAWGYLSARDGIPSESGLRSNPAV